jgi:DNA (cytosine-5)-methyltransferase 1
MSASDRPFTFAEFFAGAGMACAGLGDSWTGVLANDIDAKKCASYAANFGTMALRIDDVARLTTGGACAVAPRRAVRTGA